MNAHSTPGDADIATVAALIGEPARARVLKALADGQALPAGRLAAEAGVSASTVSAHLSRLLEARLVQAERSGRHRYFRLADPSVARALEALAEIAPPEPIRSLRQGSRARALRQARTCYQHLAGRLGVVLMGALLDRGLLAGGTGEHHQDPARDDRLTASGADVTYAITSVGEHELTAFGIDLTEVRRHPPAVRYCLDWSEQRHHLAGPLGAAVTEHLFALGWLHRLGHPRAVQLTDAGREGLHDTFGVPLAWDAVA